MEMSGLKTPVVSVVTGEGGSGGALALSVADRILMLSSSAYSVVSPEACASILWKDTDRAEEAAEALKLTAPDLLSLGIIDGIVKDEGCRTRRSPTRDVRSVRGFRQAGCARCR